MKFALCMSGQPRNLKNCYDNHIKPNLFDANPNHTIDTYVHMWFDQNQTNTELTTAVGGKASSAIPHDITTQLYECYNPKVAIIERQKEFFPRKEFYERKFEGINPIYTMSKMYSVYLSITHALNQNILDYDYVISGRFDWAFTEPVILDQFTEDALYFQDKNPHGYNVGWVFGTRRLMTTYSMLYFHLDKLFDAGVPFCDEVLAQAFCDDLKIPAKKFWSNYFILRE